MTARPQTSMQQAIGYFIYDLIFFTLACFSQQLWLTLLCALLSAVMSIRATALFADAIFSLAETAGEEFSGRVNSSQI